MRKIATFISTETVVNSSAALFTVDVYEKIRPGQSPKHLLNVGRIGGITPWLKVAHAAEAFDMPVCPHFLMELHVSLACAVPNGKYVEYIPQLDDITTSGMKVENGMAVAPSEPGIGIAWDWDIVKARSVAEFTRTITSA